MVVGIGVDLVENSRFERELLRGQWRLQDGIFTTSEIRQCSSAQPALRYAACFAAKEATLKAIGIGACDLGMFREIEVVLAVNGNYGVLLQERAKRESEQLGVRQITISIASGKTHTSAIVILESQS
jgi:holo-[acyl-carrier protein] synthase